MAFTRTGRVTGTEHLWLLLVVGLAIQVAGFVTAFAAVPRRELGPGGPTREGSEIWTLVGFLGFGLGGVLSLIAVIGFGVLLGMRAHGDPPIRPLGTPASED